LQSAAIETTSALIGNHNLVHGEVAGCSYTINPHGGSVMVYRITQANDNFLFYSNLRTGERFFENDMRNLGRDAIPTVLSAFRFDDETGLIRTSNGGVDTYYINENGNNRIVIDEDSISVTYFNSFSSLSNPSNFGFSISQKKLHFIDFATQHSRSDDTMNDTSSGSESMYGGGNEDTRDANISEGEEEYENHDLIRSGLDDEVDAILDWENDNRTDYSFNEDEDDYEGHQTNYTNWMMMISERGE